MLVRFSRSRKSSAALTPTVGGSSAGSPNSAAEKLRDTATSAESEAFSRDLKQRGFSFVGPTVAYAYMQAAGLVNDHLVSCFRYQEILTEVVNAN